MISLKNTAGITARLKERTDSKFSRKDIPRPQNRLEQKLFPGGLNWNRHLPRLEKAAVYERPLQSLHSLLVKRTPQHCFDSRLPEARHLETLANLNHSVRLSVRLSRMPEIPRFTSHGT